MDQTKGVNVIEKFVSYQGEGADTGMRMLILRFRDCSRIRPCPFCDTIGKMKESKQFFVSFDEIQDIVNTEKCGLMITGGEPTKCGNYNETMELIKRIDCNIINVESNGFDLYTMVKECGPLGKKITFSYSPKFFSESELHEEFDVTSLLSKYDNVIFKVVASKSNHFLIDYLKFLYPMNINHRVMIMPEGKTKEELFENCSFAIELADKFKFGFSSRNHILFNFI